MKMGLSHLSTVLLFERVAAAKDFDGGVLVDVEAVLERDAV